MEYLGFLTDDEDMLELIDLLEPPSVEENRENQFEKWNNADFIKRFRLSKDAVRYLLEKIGDVLASPTESDHDVAPEDMVFVTLRFYATASLLQVVTDFVGIDKSTASQIVREVSRAIAGLCSQFVKMPSSEEQLINNCREFYEIARFPRCIGAIDCTHIKIAHPGETVAEIFRNKKGFCSMNVQIVCSATLKIQNIVCRWPGSTQDSKIFNKSVLKRQCQGGRFRHFVMVGDGAYSIKPFLITPLTNPRTPAEHLFNESHTKTRNPVERCFYVWKRRFPILVHGTELVFSQVEAVVVATAVLHNIAGLFKDPLPPAYEEEEVDLQLADVEPINNVNNINSNNMTRFRLINRYFSTLPYD